MTISSNASPELGHSPPVVHRLVLTLAMAMLGVLTPTTSRAELPAEVDAPSETSVHLALDDEALRAYLEGELRARGLCPVTGDSTGQVRLWLEGSVAVVWTSRGATRLPIDRDDPFTSAVALASLIEEALVVPPPPPPPPPRRVRAVGVYFGGELGGYLFTEPILGHARARHVFGAQWADGARVGLVVDLSLYQWMGAEDRVGGMGLFGTEVGGRVPLGSLVLFRLEAQAQLGNGFPRSIDDPSTGIAGAVGGDLGLGFDVDSHVEIALRLGASVFLEDGEAATALLRVGARIEWH